MLRINSLIPTVNKYKGKLPAFSSKITEYDGDIFIKQDNSPTVKECAKSFREGIIKPFSDWKHPDIFEEDNKITSNLFSPFVEIVDKFSKDEASYFAKLVFGEDTIEAFEEASKRNTDVKLFKDTLEKRLGVSIKECIKCDF